MRETTPQRTMRRDFVFKEKRKGQADDGVTCDEKRNCDDSPKHRPGSGEQHRGERGTGKSHQCPICEYSCVKLSNMKRHINRKHTRAVGKRAFQSGKCLCLECGHRCFRIKDLRKHLSTEHGVIFKTEILQMQNAKGKVYSASFFKIKHLL